MGALCYGFGDKSSCMLPEADGGCMGCSYCEGRWDIEFICKPEGVCGIYCGHCNTMECWRTTSAGSRAVDQPSACAACARGGDFGDCAETRPGGGGACRLCEASQCPKDGGVRR